MDNKRITSDIEKWGLLTGLCQYEMMLDIKYKGITVNALG